MFALWVGVIYELVIVPGFRSFVQKPAKRVMLLKRWGTISSLSRKAIIDQTLIIQTNSTEHLMTPQPLPRSTPESQGIRCSAIQEFITTAEQHIQSLHSLMLLRHGFVVAEGWWYPYRSEAPHVLFSLSKSFTSSAVGLAVSEGLLSVEDPLLQFFPDESPRKISPNLAAMQVRHLLTMTTGHHEDTTEATMLARNPFKAFLKLPVEHQPGTYFIYNSAASYMLAAIVQKLTRQTLIEYLTPRLFEPLGIQGATWDSHPNGVNFGGWGLNLKTEDIARFGQLYLQKGLWNGQQLVPIDWVEAATAKQVSNGLDENSDWEQGYGYQFWRCQPQGVYRGDGAFGQFCIVMPEQDAVLAITAGVAEMQPVLDLVWEKLLPAIGKEALSEHDPTVEKLKSTLQGLLLFPPIGAHNSPQADAVTGRVFSFEPNHLTLDSLSLNFTDNVLTYRLLGGGKRRGTHQLKFGVQSWVEGTGILYQTIAQPNPEPRKVAASGVWSADDTFTLTLCHYQTPFTQTLDFRFAGQKVYFDSRDNVSFGSLEAPQLVGKTS
jgi:CubicO group peptidase (beta-lactamase class C family)